MTIERVHSWVRNRDTDLFNVVACQGNDPSDSDVAAFERVCGYRLPTEFRDFTMSPLGGLYAEARAEVWPRAEPHQVGPFWSFLRGVMVFGIATEIPEWLDLRIQYAALRDEGFPALVPFLQRETDADKYCFNPAGAIVLWRHDDPEDQEPQGVTFAELLARELEELEDRTRRRLKGEHL
jgi:hypothetical protein